MRPRGTPPTPSARSSDTEPVEMAWMSCTRGSSVPSLITEPLPNCFSMALTASSMAFSFSAFATRSLRCALRGAFTESLYRTRSTSSRFRQAYQGGPTSRPGGREALALGGGPPLLDALPGHRDDALAHRRGFVGELQLVARKLDGPLLVGTSPVGEGAALEVHGEELVRFIDVVRPEV